MAFSSLINREEDKIMKSMLENFEEKVLCSDHSWKSENILPMPIKYNLLKFVPFFRPETEKRIITKASYKGFIHAS